MLMKKPRLLMLAPMLLVSGCATKPASSPPPTVAPARIPPLSPEDRQPPAPPWCSPNCATGLMHERESWRKRLIERE
jgi:hypothetical protein